MRGSLRGAALWGCGFPGRTLLRLGACPRGVAKGRGLATEGAWPVPRAAGLVPGNCDPGQ